MVESQKIGMTGFPTNSFAGRSITWRAPLSSSSAMIKVASALEQRRDGPSFAGCIEYVDLLACSI